MDFCPSEFSSIPEHAKTKRGFVEHVLAHGLLVHTSPKLVILSRFNEHWNICSKSHCFVLRGSPSQHL